MHAHDEPVAQERMMTSTRREFLRQSGLTLAGSVLAGSLIGLPRFATAARSDSRKLRIGVVGGAFGAQFYWHEHPDCIVEAVSDLIPERRKHLQEVYHCAKAYESLEILIKDPQIDAVALFTAPPDHVRHAVAILKAGKHVLCAVPAIWGPNHLEQAELLLDTVKSSGLTYMMAETSHFRQPRISAQRMYQAGELGEIYHSESMYLHYYPIDASKESYGVRDWGWGMPPMWYPTHCLEFITGMTGEQMASVTCIGFGEPSPMFKENDYKNPFYTEQSMFITDKGHSHNVMRGYSGAIGSAERAVWHGTKQSFHMPWPEGLPIDDSFIIPLGDEWGARKVRKFDQEIWWKTDMLPEKLRHDSDHGGSHVFIVHEFIEAVLDQRKPAVDVYDAIACTLPGHYAHESALKGGEHLKIPAYPRPAA